MKKCIIWGTGKGGERAQALAKYMNWEIYGYCDKKYNEIKRNGSYCVISPKELELICDKEKIDIIIIGVLKQRYVDEIKLHLSKIVCKEIQIYTVRELSDEYEKEYLRYKKQNIDYKWDVDFESQAHVWVDNLYTEVEYWINENVKESGAWHENYLHRLRNEEFIGLDKDIIEFAGHLKENDIVMDLGCGLLTKYGNKIGDEKLLNVVPVDPLAFFYDALNSKYHADEFRGRNAKFGLFEFIANFFDENYADAIIINNALDHCIDPLKSIIECLYIIKVGGKIHLNHRRAEALYENYSGLHKWNIDYNNADDLIFWNEEYAVNVSEKIKDIVDIQVFHTEDNISRGESKVIVEMTKKKAFHFSQYYSLEEEARMLAVLLEKLMGLMAKESKYIINGEM